MQTLHYGCAIVRHPDTSALYRERMNYYSEKNKCRYGVTVWTCPDAVKYARENTREGVKVSIDNCPLSNCGLCDNYCSQVMYGTRKKTYGITNRIKNEIIDRGAWLYQNADNKLVFATLTVPPFIKKLSKHETETELNKAFSRFIENLRGETYKCTHYIAVREGDGINKRYHYHVIMDIPFIDFRRINIAWVHSLDGICEYSPNAFTTDRDARTIKSISSASRYIAKYVSKSIGDRHDTRVYFTDRDTARAVITTEIFEDITVLKSNYPTLEGYRFNDYVVRYSVKDRKVSDRFFNDIVKTFFDSTSDGSELIIFTDE